MVQLNTNPEILLKKRKDQDRKRLEKQEQARERKVDQERKRKQRKDKLIRAETLVSNYRSNEIEKMRIDHISKHEKMIKKAISENTEMEPKLLLVIRVPDHQKGLKIPSKANKVLSLLRLTKANTAVFVKMTSTLLPLFKLIHPYVVVGKPSLASIRKLFQKRASITVNDAETNMAKTVYLDDNNVVEEQLGQFGIICAEDLIHEIAALGENFKTVNLWLNPFKLNLPVRGYGPLAKLARVEYAEENDRKISIAGNVQLNEIDIDKFLEQQN